MLKFNPNTPICFYEKVTTYVPGKGNTSAWNKLVTNAMDTFYGEWRGSFGDRALSAQALGVKDSATFRTFFNPSIYLKLKSTQILIVKNADSSAIKDGEPDKANPNVYELWGGVDNVLEENKYMEFRVRRYEAI